LSRNIKRPPMVHAKNKSAESASESGMRRFKTLVEQTLT